MNKNIGENENTSAEDLLNKNTIIGDDHTNGALVLDGDVNVALLSSEAEQTRGHKRRLYEDSSTTEKSHTKIHNSCVNKNEVEVNNDDPKKELGDNGAEVSSSSLLLRGEAVVENNNHDNDDDVNSNNNNGEEEEELDVAGDDTKISTPSFAELLPEGMRLEWNSDKTSAILYISKNSNGDDDNNNTTNRELRVCLVGRAKIKVLEGSAEVLGYNLNDDNIHDDDDDKSDSSSSMSMSMPMGVVVTSPYWSSWMTIEANPMSLPCRIEFNCIRGAESFKVVAPKRPIVLPSSWRTCVDDIVQDCSIGCCRGSTDTNNNTVDYFDQEVEDVKESKNNNNERHACMITGAKGTGKSTLLRYMTNRLLSSSNGKIGGVAILDTDVGQPELAPPGLLRLAIVRSPLLRPPYWNLVDGVSERDEIEDNIDENNNNNDCDDDDDVEVISSVFFGAVTSKVDPTRYINAVQMLMDKYETEVVQRSPDPIPLLINMDGWVKGMGYQILTTLIEIIRPTHLVQILGETKGQIFDLPPHLFDNNTDNDEETNGATINPPPPKLYRLPACQNLPKASLCRIPALTLRNFRWAAYFLPHQLQTFDAWDFVSAKELQTGWIAATSIDKTTTASYRPKGLLGNDDCYDNDVDDGGNDVEETITKEEEGALNDECRLAQALAREVPYCVPMEAVEAFVIGSDFEDFLRIPDDIDASAEDDIEPIRNRIFQALNGSIVALCTDTTTMESLGYGVLRSIDWNRRLLYVLVPSSLGIKPSVLSQVKALVGGNLPLPLAMLYRGVYAESFPYLTTLSPSSSLILGSAPMKSRNNITRRGLAKASEAAARR
ncbi:MAG: energy-coupling factor transporter ATP-binding protein EcfA2 [Bacillariaceae sp.]|jgi:energy-coupling factor transporter ATP-binding protein EcfA2